MRSGEQRRRGSAALETALWMPVLLLLLVGMVQIGKTTYIYYTLKKTLYGVATIVASQQSVDFCDLANPIIASAKTLALSGTADAEAESTIPSLTADMIQVDTECTDAASGEVGPCDSGGCEGPAGGPRPDFIIVSIPDGYQVPLRIPYMLLDPLLLKPEVRMPYGGT